MSFFNFSCFRYCLRRRFHQEVLHFALMVGLHFLYMCFLAHLRLGLVEDMAANSESCPEDRSDTPGCCIHEHWGVRSHTRPVWSYPRPSECNDRQHKKTGRLDRDFSADHLVCPQFCSDTSLKKPAMFSP